jgi:hypothetical protein
VCACLCVLVHKAHGHCDCSEAMHACVRVCVWACARCMLTVLFGRPCTYESECVVLINWSAERVNQIYCLKHQVPALMSQHLTAFIL